MLDCSGLKLTYPSSSTKRQSSRTRRLSNWRVERSTNEAYIWSNKSWARMNWQRYPFSSAFNSRPDASPVLPTPGGPTSTRFSALAMKSSSARVWICLRLTPGWRAKGKLAINKRTGKVEQQPEVVMRGFGGADITDQARELVLKTLDGLTTEQKSDYGMVKEKVRAELKRLIQKTTGRR